MRARIVEIRLLKGCRRVCHRLSAIRGDVRNFIIFAYNLILIDLRDLWRNDMSLRSRGIDLLDVRNDVLEALRLGI